MDLKLEKTLESAFKNRLTDQYCTGGAANFALSEMAKGLSHCTICFYILVTKYSEMTAIICPPSVNSSRLI